MLLKNYLDAVQFTAKSGQSTEASFYPYLKCMLEQIDKKILVTVEPKRIKCGAPDFIVSRSIDNVLQTVGYIEGKDINTSLDEVETSEQLLRYRQSVNNLILTNFLEFRWYIKGKKQHSVYLYSSRSKKVNRSLTKNLLNDFLSHKPVPPSEPEDLAKRMAHLTHLISHIIIQEFKHDSSSETLNDLRAVLTEILIPELSVQQFADIFSQTLSYGLFTARYHHKSNFSFSRKNVISEIPNANPFLKRLFNTITGPDFENEPFISFVDDLVQLLANTDIRNLLCNMGQGFYREDPVTYFYETFLSFYNPELREKRGVYFTPKPVVSYIIKSVDHLLKKQFNCVNGLAGAGNLPSDFEIRNKTTEDSMPQTLILDPACGTGSFIYNIISFIRSQFIEENRAGEWPGYVRNCLLPRLFGFELLMAPYAISHLKLEYQLHGLDLPPEIKEDWSFCFENTERLGIYLTNSLEEGVKKSEILLGSFITKEANAAISVKRDLPIMVVLGNPPYSGHSANNNPWINRLMRDYYQIDGKPLNEKNTKWLQDDYVKFIRFGQWRIEKSSGGILAFITNHSYLDNPTFRGMRKELLDKFSDIYILDLHGNSNKKEKTPRGLPDKNVFDIQQGVAIGIFIKEKGKTGPASLHQADLWGTRESKYEWLMKHDINSTNWHTITPQPPFYLYNKEFSDSAKDYLKFWKINEAMPVNSVCIVTGRDNLVFDYTETELKKKLNNFLDAETTDDAAREMYLSSKDKLPVPSTRKLLRHLNIEESIHDCLYRPFDIRPLIYQDAVIERGRKKTMSHMLKGKNLGLITVRQVAEGIFNHAFVSNTVVESRASISNKGISYIFPLYIYPESDLESSMGIPKPNFNNKFISHIAALLNLSFKPFGSTDAKSSFGSEDLFNYIYAVLHSPKYRTKYADYLKIDFPRIPLTKDLDLFQVLVKCGSQLTGLHLLKSAEVENLITRYPIPGSNIVQKGHPKFMAKGTPEPSTGIPLNTGRVYINKGISKNSRGQYFEGIDEKVWDFHLNGYRVCQKWLKYRKGRALSYEEIMLFQKIVKSISQTIKIMDKIDDSISDFESFL